MQRLLITAGVVLLVIGLVWPVVASMPIGRLLGDIVIERPGFRLHLPLTTMLLASALLSLLLWLLRR